MSNEIQTAENKALALAQAYPIAQLDSLAQAFVDCGFYGFHKKAEALVLMLQARADGIDPMTAAAQYSIIQGRPTLKAEAILVRFQSAGGSIKWLERSNEICRLWLSHPRGGELEVCWDKARAQLAKLWDKDNFKKHPAQMLAARCISEGVRALYPACLSGCYTPEEAEFFAPAGSAAPAPGPSPVSEHQKAEAPAPAPEAPKRGRPKKAEAAEAVDAEVVEPATEKPAENSAEASFIVFMNDLRDVNKSVFDSAWSEYDYENFAAVPAENRQQVYTAIKRKISAAEAANVNTYLEG